MDCDNCKQVKDCRFSDEGRQTDYCRYYIMGELPTAEGQSVTPGYIANDIKELRTLAEKLLKFAAKMGEEPYFITSPTIGIVKQHKDIIKKYNLL